VPVGLFFLHVGFVTVCVLSDDRCRISAWTHQERVTVTSQSKRKATKIGGLLAGIAAAALLAGASGAAAGAEAQTAASASPTVSPAADTAQPSKPWAQTKSDVPADPAVRFGTLPNGMRYAIMHNATPPGQTSLKLRIDAGSLMEKDDQLGLAHFMEHMAFNGTTHIPKNDLIKILERMGLAFGADLNAATSWDQTFYQLELPRSDDETVGTGLHVLREQVSEATMKMDDIVGERGVIEGEERLRNTPSLRADQADLAIKAKGQLVVDRFPIGDMKIVDTAPRDRFVRFYDAYYRPSRATLIAVGDFDVDAMEAKIRKQFGDWAPKAPDGPEPDLGKVAERGQESHVVVIPGASPTVELAWVSAPEIKPDTVANRKLALMKSLGLVVLDRRLTEIARTDDPPFVNAGAGRTDTFKSLHVDAILASYFPGKWKAALGAIEQEQRRLAEFGISDAELQREITNGREGLVQQVASAGTRNTRELNNMLLTSVNDDRVFVTPQTKLALFDEAVKGLKASDINAVLKDMFKGEGPVAILHTSTAIEGGEAALAAALQTSQQVAVAAPVPPVVKAWAYTDFGTPGIVQSRREIPEIGATVVTFANGAELTVKQTNFDKDGIAIRVMTGRGEQAFSPEHIDLRPAAISTMHDGGLGKMTADELSRSLTGHSVGSGLMTAENRFVLAGSTRPQDLQLEMQLLAAYLTDPAFRSAPYEKMKTTYQASLDLTRADPMGAFRMESGVLLAGGDQRKAVATAAQVAGSSMDAYRDSLKQLLSDGPLRIAMVGDLSVDDAIKVTASTFGALPARKSADAPVPGADRRVFPAATQQPLHFTHTGVSEQGLGFVAWPGVDAVGSIKEAQRVLLLNAVLQLRILDEIREREGLAYSPSSSAVSSDAFPGYGYIAAAAATTPQKLPAYFAAMDRIAQSLRDKPISADELKRAREPMLAAIQRNRSSNGWWLNMISDAANKPARVQDMLNSTATLESVTPADIQALARQYLRPDKAWKAEVTPQSLGNTSQGAAVTAAVIQ